MGTGGCGGGEDRGSAGLFVFRSDLRVPGEGLELATVGKQGLTRTPGPRTLAAAVGVPGLGRVGEGEGVQGPQRHRAERRTASPECCAEWAGPRGAPARALGGRNEPEFSGERERPVPGGEEAARPPSVVQVHAARSARPTRSQRREAAEPRGAAGPEAAFDRLFPRVGNAAPQAAARSAAGLLGGADNSGKLSTGRRVGSRELAPPPLLQNKNYLLLKLQELRT